MGDKGNKTVSTRILWSLKNLDRRAVVRDTPIAIESVTSMSPGVALSPW